MRKLAVLVPWESPFIWSAAAFNLMNLQHPEDFEVRYIQGKGWCPANRHNDAVVRAINWGAHAMVFMGGDHYTDEDTLVKLVAHLDAGWDMAAGWVPSRGVVGIEERPFPYLAYRKKNPELLPSTKYPVLHFNEKEWEIVTNGAPSQEIHIIGTGILMFKIDVVRDMKRPWFGEFLRQNDFYDRYPVQDSHFTYRATIIGGHGLWLDTTINAKHLDVFPIDETYEKRFEDKAGTQWTPTLLLGISDEERGENAVPTPIYSNKQ